MEIWSLEFRAMCEKWRNHVWMRFGLGIVQFIPSKQCVRVRKLAYKYFWVCVCNRTAHRSGISCENVCCCWMSKHRNHLLMPRCIWYDIISWIFTWYEKQVPLWMRCALYFCTIYLYWCESTMYMRWLFSANSSELDANTNINIWGFCMCMCLMLLLFCLYVWFVICMCVFVSKSHDFLSDVHSR